MTHNNNHGRSRGDPESIRWLSDSIRISVEETVSRYTGRVWRAKNGTDLRDFACHDCAIVTDDSFAVFFKYGDAPDTKRQFEIELSDLRTLSKTAGVLIPSPIDIIPEENGWLLIMEALNVIERGPRQWREIGQSLARIHQVRSAVCGYERDGFCGPLPQDNTPEKSWAVFYRDRRLLPRLKAAIDSGNIPASVVSGVEKLAARLPELSGPETTPTLLHGDAQQNNFISTTDGTFVIDPAVYYGNPEADLALLDSFQPVPVDVFDAYREEMSIDSGFFERRDLWRIPLYLAAVAIEGPMHLNRLTDAIHKYL